MKNGPWDCESSGGVKVRAEDERDLAVIAACLQDALAHERGMSYLPRKSHFASTGRFQGLIVSVTLPLDKNMTRQLRR